MTIWSHAQQPNSFQKLALFDDGAQDNPTSHAPVLVVGAPVTHEDRTDPRQDDDAGPEVRSTGLAVVPGASTRDFCGEANVRRRHVRLSPSPRLAFDLTSLYTSGGSLATHHRILKAAPGHLSTVTSQLSLFDARQDGFS